MHVPTLSFCSRVIGLLISFLMIGCSGYQYVASPRYVPLNERKGDINVYASLTGGQLGYAFSNKFSAFATGFKRFETVFEKNQWPDGERRRNGESREINLGLTYFGAKEKLHYEVVVGGGMGDMTFHSNYEDDGPSFAGYTMDMEADKWNVFIQPNFSYKIHERVNKHLALAVFTKFNSVNYYNTVLTRESFDDSIGEWREIQVTDLTPNPKYDEGLVYFSNHEKSNLFFIEPGVFVKGGGRYFKGSLQLSYVINAGGPSLYYQPFSLSLGCAINFNVFDLKAAIKDRKK
jgi:hypothetical protein